MSDWWATLYEEGERIIAERGKTHGDWKKNSSVAQYLKATVRANAEGMNPGQREALDLICTKIARIVCGDANEVDHWRDIAGYAELVVKDLQKP